MELAETKIGRLDHKIEKLQILELVPGVEFLARKAASGSNGLCLEEFAPFGVIGVVTPVTHSVPTLSANAINMIASGNSLVANAHPSGANCAAHGDARIQSDKSRRNSASTDLSPAFIPPTLETAEQLFNHRGVSLLVVTGGPSVARAAMTARKRRDRRRAGQSAGGRRRNGLPAERRDLHRQRRGLRQQPPVHRRKAGLLRR